ncbi:RagB/SusD family nutrient uptake outer membrane protein [Arcticibacterium luteifluviistationis]|uniref:RagB/SusD family nutrient uptake outer membrane protein n=1 Tax=Arcticibacterium luteifluviistationis TaxID=1784714 RepID=A0A2Z4G7M9_9BACT|nr:RagB/SusD family nutrient uptake outer membrane protein [Arcticibacterium luteifluviistationis]AWV97115.1 hypothetical protein DJ013_02570 [Arcticibacterium luteifluviistationis]
MKIFNIKQVAVLLTCSVLIGGCDNYIEEDIYSGITSENFLSEDNVDQLVIGLYDATRDVYKNYGYKFAGTDIFTSKSEVFSFSSENDYNSFNAPQSNGVWSSNYGVISKANTAINRYETQIDWSDANLENKAYGIAQARALRALAYFNLAVQYGGVALELDEPQSIRTDYTRSSEEETYALIISELEGAIPALKDAPETGRFSKRAAQHLLAEVYLTRAYKSYAGGNDFQMAADLAIQAIGSYDIRSQSFAELFDYDNQVNSEILFAAHWGDTGFAEDRGNNKHSLFMSGVESLPGVSRSNLYGKTGDGLMMTPYFYSLFADNDSRENVTMHRAIIADEAGFAIGSDEIAIGDTVVYFPKHALSEAELKDKLERYWVYQPDQYLYGRPETIAGVNYQFTANPILTNFPMMKKFDDEIFQEENNGARDTYIFRVAETHLIAAEAILGAGNTTQALVHINRVRERATGVADHYTSLDLDTILEERALELAGEENRWATLKRMGKLEARVGLYNPHYIDHGAFDAAKHILRPIPLIELEISPSTMTQNSGY